MIMPNHVHSLILPMSNWELEDLLASIKKWSSREIGTCLATMTEIILPTVSRSRHRLWQQESLTGLFEIGANYTSGDAIFSTMRRKRACRTDNICMVQRISFR